MESIDTVVIGAGQAGLAASYHLAARGRRHVVLERARVGEAWRTRRWDSFTLVGPNWTCTLPGHPYTGADPDGYMRRRDLIELFEGYARSFAAPILEGVAVRRLSRSTDGRFALATDGETYVAANVIVATGPYQRPRIPPTARRIDANVMQLHTDAYRAPGQLPDGAVVVVGSGQSGCQIAEELAESGRTVYLSTSGNGWFPRRYRGKDNVRWRDEMGFFDRTVDTLKSPVDRMAAVPTQTGKGGGHDLSLRTLAALGVVLAGRFVDADASHMRFAADLRENMTRSDTVARSLMTDIDAFIARTGVTAPPNDRDLFEDRGVKSVDEVDIKRAGVSAVIWGTGYDLDFGWIDVPVLDPHGYPMQRRGVTEVPGLYFLGLHFMHTRKSGLIWGVGEDADHVVDHLATRRGTMVAS